jgi:leucine-rich repeat-containing G protein-coupled receptor 8
MGWGTYCLHVDCQGHYKCRGSYCIPVRKVCDGVIDCPIGDDEHACADYICPGLMRCSGVSFCVHPNELCDGVAHCPLQEDEAHCETCPPECECSGSAIHCSLPPVPAPNTTSLYSPSALILRNLTSITTFLNIFNTNYMILFDLRNISIDLISDYKLKFLNVFKSVKFLYLNDIGLTLLPPYFIRGLNVIYANISHNNIYSIEMFAFDTMLNIRVLSLASNSLQTLDSHFCKELEYLTDLYLTDNPLISIAHSGFLENPGLKLIRSSWYIVCCLAAHVEDCAPQNEFISSCSNLISSVVQRVCIMGESLVIVLGNIGAVMVQMISREDTKHLAMNLALADVLMGGYLLAIASVDVAYSGVFYTIVQTWPENVPCLVLGLLNFTSSQVSLLVLCLLSVARMVSIDKIAGMASIKGKIWKACVVAWILATAAGVTYTFLLYSRGQGARNNLCITIGISAHYRRISTMELIFQSLFIVFNLCVLAVIISSMVYIFHVVAKSMNSVRQVGISHQQHSFRLIKLGRRLLLLLTCNVLSWLPFMCVSILLLLGVPVHDYVVQWIAILGVPICAFTDPFLYSIAPLKASIKNNPKQKGKISAFPACFGK